MLHIRAPRDGDLGRTLSLKLILSDDKYGDAQEANNTKANDSVWSPVLWVWPPAAAGRPHLLRVLEARTAPHSAGWMTRCTES